MIKKNKNKWQDKVRFVAINLESADIDQGESMTLINAYKWDEI